MESNRHPDAPVDKDEWMTPSDVIEFARTIMGEIDFDPCSTEEANKRVLARQYFTKEDNALARDWPHYQRIFMNPPFSRGKMDRFVDKIVELEVRHKLQAAFVITNNSTETRWAQKLAQHCTAVHFPEGRIGFLGPDGTPVKNNNRGQAFWYFGGNKRLFRQTLEGYGVVLERISNDRYLT